MALPLTIDFPHESDPRPHPAPEWPPRLTLVPPLSPSAVSPSARPPVTSPPALSRAVYRRRRLGVLITIGLLVAVGLSVVGTPSSGASRSPLPAAGAETAAVYLVQPGDTLWAIAGSIAPGHDRRAAVDQLAAANGGADLQVGQRLVVPSSLRGGSAF
jgi:Tfp pilus assembly protein FimV